MAGKKKNSNATYAFIGLIITIVACVATGLLLSAKFFTGIGMFTLPDTIKKGVDLALQISFGLVIVGLAVYAILNPDSIRRFFTGRQARYGSNSLILVIAFVGILFAVNYIVYNNPNLLNAPYDFTEDKTNTLAPETLQILATLPDKVTATAFYSSSTDPSSAQQLLEKFKTHSNGKFTYSFVNPDADPVAARQAGITGDGKIMLQMGDTKEIASFAGEEEIARAMIRLISPGSRAVYFLQGHGEISLETGGDLSYSTAKTTLEAKNYTVNTLDLGTAHKVPDDAMAIVIVGPQKPVSDEEVKLLKAYVDNGGSLVVLEDPRFFTQFGDAKDPLADYLANDWGITLNNDVVIDVGNSQNPFQAISSRYSQHPITADISSNLRVVLPQARSLSIAGTLPANVSDTWLISTAENSWGETELDPNATPTFDPAKDVQGPLYLAVAGENSQTKGRVVVFGNSLFAIDGNFDVYGNGNFFINSVDWAAEQESILNLTTHQKTQRIFNPPAESWKFLLIVLVIVIIIPGMIVFFGISSWISRRRRG